MAHTLVYYISEFDMVSKKIDNRIFFFYDHENDRFQIRGTRAYANDPDRLSKNGKIIKPYSFCCNTIVNLVFFLKFLFDKSNRFSHDLISVPNLPLDSNAITFELLEEHHSTHLELSGYDYEKLSFRRIEDALEAVRSIYNDY